MNYYFLSPVILTVSGEIPFKTLTPKRDSANSPLERGLGVCYSLKQEHRFGFGVHTRPELRQIIHNS
jgi:hypothetical protein